MIGVFFMHRSIFLLTQSILVLITVFKNLDISNILFYFYYTLFLLV